MKMFAQKITVLITLVALLLGSASCGKKGAAGKPSDVDYYTCTMHPSVHSKDPGKCPICSMDLVPVMKKGGTETQPPQTQGEQMKGVGETKGMAGMPGMPGMKEGEMKGGEKPGEFVVPVERQQQIGVRYAKVERKPLGHTIRAVGLIVPDKARSWQFVSRVDGYVQKLDVTAPGELVEKDAPLLSIYSPDLLTSERD
jgi:Cu(I)/Ag(I) efflux system membrane fusion protein